MSDIWKVIRDIFSNRNILVITLTQSLFMLTATLWWPYWSRYAAARAFISRIFGAIGEGFGGTIMGGPAWQALVADIIPSDRRGWIMGLMGTLIGLLSLPGTWIGGYLYDFVSPMAPFYTSFGLGIAAFLIFVIFVNEPKEKIE